MRKKQLAYVAAFCASLSIACAEVPELLELVPQAKGYELVYKLNPKNYAKEGYQVDNSESITGEVVKIGYLLKTTAKDGSKTWAFASFDPFTQDLAKIGVPDYGSGTIQTYVNNMEVFGNGKVKTGKFEKGNIEFWPYNYGGANVMKIPNATGAFDFGDEPSKDGGYGSMQIHNYLQKETAIAFNNFNQGSPDIGIGNNPAGGHLDWTFSKSAEKLESAELYVVAKFKNAKFQKVTPIDSNKIDFRAVSDKLDYSPNEEMTFTFTIDFGGQPAPKKPYSFKWTRTGDDGLTESGTSEISPDKPVSIKTKLGKPGFVRLTANLLNSRGKQVTKTSKDKKERIFFDGGAGVEISKIKEAVPEPEDFDAFWQKQKARLKKVPMKYKMGKVSAEGANPEVYAVTIDCAGPRPVTGYLTIPAGAAEKSLPAQASYHGYGTHVQKAPKGWGGAIRFDVNAHGYDLGKDKQYYDKFFEGIKSNGHIYAFDPKQNSNPEEAYFNGMVLRLLRSLEFLKSLPQWNGKDLKVSGGSQGGLQTIWAAGLDPDVTEADSSITWCCDFAGPTIGRLGGWRPQYVPALGYYDAANHGKRIKCKTVISRAGLGDYTCPPSGLAVLYNNIKAPKKIKWVQGSTHGFVPKNPQQWIIRDKYDN